MRTAQQKNEAELAAILVRLDKRAGAQADWKKTKIQNWNPDELVRETCPELDDFPGRESFRQAENTRQDVENLYARAMSATSRSVAFDSEELWRKHIAPSMDAREWLKSLGEKIDANNADNRKTWARLRDHVLQSSSGSRVKDLDERIVETCLKYLCPQEEGESDGQ